MLIKEKSPMHEFEWHRCASPFPVIFELRPRRVVLDEAHNIKERTTNAAKAAFALSAKYRWCLSGTPLQNRVGELYSLVRFLGADPFRLVELDGDRNLRLICGHQSLLLQEVRLQELALAILRSTTLQPM